VYLKQAAGLAARCPARVAVTRLKARAGPHTSYTCLMSDLFPEISRAVALATRLRVISERGRDAESKQLVADLLLELAGVQLRLDELLNENAALKGQLQTHSNPKGERCPRCFEFGWRVTASRPHGQLGGMVQTYGCAKCGLKEEVVVKGT
jgi:predicted RNA-binding Zn-ribbon protein involved in translation (DUF1610 family)